MSDGMAMLEKEEILAEVTIPAGGVHGALIDLNPLSSGFFSGYLAAHAKLHEQLRWQTLDIKWVSAVGTTEGGVLFYGIDWIYTIGEVSGLTAAKVAALSPNANTSLWQEHSLNARVAAHQYQKWLPLTDATKSGVGQVVVYARGPAKLAGYFMIKYRVEFAGTRLP